MFFNDITACNKLNITNVCKSLGKTKTATTGTNQSNPNLLSLGCLKEIKFTRPKSRKACQCQSTCTYKLSPGLILIFHE